MPRCHMFYFLDRRRVRNVARFGDGNCRARALDRVDRRADAGGRGFSSQARAGFYRASRRARAAHPTCAPRGDTEEGASSNARQRTRSISTVRRDAAAETPLSSDHPLPTRLGYREVPDPTAGGSAANASDGRRRSRLRARTPGVRDRGPRRVPGRIRCVPTAPTRSSPILHIRAGGGAPHSRDRREGRADPTRGARATRARASASTARLCNAIQIPPRDRATRAPSRDPRAGAPRGSFGRLTVPKSARRPLAQLSGAVYEGVFHRRPSDAEVRALNPSLRTPPSPRDPRRLARAILAIAPRVHFRARDSRPRLATDASRERILSRLVPSSRG